MTSSNQTLAVSADTIQANAPSSDRQESNNSSTTDSVDVQVKAKQRTPRRKFSTAYKLKILEEYDACDNALSRGALLRKEGIYHSILSTWRKQRDEGKLSTTAKKKTSKVLLSNQKLVRENAQLKKKLLQAEAIIDLQKKVSDLLGAHILPPESSEIN